MPRRINKVILYICNACQAVYNESREAKEHWRGAHAAPPAAPARRGRPRKA